MITVKDTPGATSESAPTRQDELTNSDGPRTRRPGPGLFARLAAKFSPRQERHFEGPVAWLLGSQMLGSIKGILLYSAYGKKLDPRDWMTARAFSFDPANQDRRYVLPKGIDNKYLAEALEDKKGFWFDYISDTGDGMRATYSIAYLSLCDFTLPSFEPEDLRAGMEPGKLKGGARAPDGEVRLPSGEFLLVGGDTAYHASDYMTLVDRIQNTFNWAYQDAVCDKRVEEGRLRPIFGIPGNHDYYDQLAGFRLQFRHPSRWEPVPGRKGPAPQSYLKRARLTIGGHYRTQEASYMALRLPYGWRLWGLDTEVGQIDNRQKNFFKHLCREEGEGPDGEATPPERLIVATCSPTTAFGKLADPKDYKSADAFGQLDLAQPFLPADKDKAKERGEAEGFTYDLSETGDARLAPGQCRLDLSGDVHHYARYWGPEPPAGTVPPRADDGKHPRAQAPTAKSYASVVSGIGGAFHHPSQTYVGHVREQSLYPSERESTGEVSRSIFKFWKIWSGGYVQLAGAIVAAILYFAFAVPQSSREFIHNLLPDRLALTDPQEIKPTVLRPTPTPAPQANSAAAAAAPRTAAPEQATATESANGDSNEEKEVATWWGTTKILGVTRSDDPGKCQEGSPRYFFGPCGVPAPPHFWWGVLALLLSPIPLFVAAFRKRFYEKDKSGGDIGTDANPSHTVQTPQGEEIKPEEEHDLGAPGLPVGLLSGGALLLLLLGAFAVTPYWEHITPFANSLLVLLTVIWAGAAAALGIRYSEYLFKKQQHHARLGWFEGWLPWLLPLAGVVAFGFGLWAFGQNNPAALLISDGLFVAVVIALAIGLVWALPFKVGADLFSTKPKAVAWVGKFLIGFLHFVLQISVPLLLVRRSSLLLWLLVALVVAAGTVAGGWLMRRGFGGLMLAFAWVVTGVLTLALPYLISYDLGQGFSLTSSWFAGPKWTGWLGLFPTIIAGVVGSVMCCYWFGWYLGVCFAFNGHNNEVGGAARIERYKQFIRFRLTEGSLTGYVIAVNDPSEKGDKLRPHLVDVFRLEPKRGA